MTLPALEMRDVSVRLGGKHILRSLSLRVESGERIVIIGPSGSGKTTLLRTIAGFAECADGNVSVAGRDATALPPERRDAVYMHQTPVLFPHLSVFDNVAFPMRVRRVQDEETRERVTAALDAMQMGSFAGRNPGTLSGGQKHRVALARAIVARPAVLLLDEPFSALDPALKRDIRAALLAAHAQYRPGLLVVTHDFSDAVGIADRIGVLIAGELVQLASPAELFEKPATLEVARFLDIANEVTGHSDGAGRFISPIGELHIATALPAGSAVAVFSPSAIRVGTSVGVPARVLESRVYPEHTTLMLEVAGITVEAACPAGVSFADDSETTAEIDAGRITVFSTEADDVSRESPIVDLLSIEWVI